MTDLRIWRSASDVPADLGRTVVTIGNFDGVHLGHQHVLRRARELAGELGAAEAVAVTFDPHPMAVLRPEHAPSMLTGVEDRARLLVGAGADAVLVLPVRPGRRRVDARGVHPAGAGRRAARVRCCGGANFRFGNKAAGDVATLREAGERLDFVTAGIAARRWAAGLVVDVRPHLPGRRRRRRGGRGPGPAVHRARRGRGGRQARPRARLPHRQRAHARGFATPTDGVYAGWLRRCDTGERFPAAISVGTNPTFTGVRERRVESYVLDRTDLELYGVEVEVSFVERIRGMVRFDGVEALVATMNDDVARVRAVLAA